MNAILQSVTQFVREAYAELKKVTWLSRKEVVASTIVIIFLIILVAIFVVSIDKILQIIFSLLFQAR
jgi:preprotein translocase subunit SecE